MGRGGRFRQTGFFGSNIIVGTVLGILSGKYIFDEPLQRYWAEKNAVALASASGTASGEGTRESSGGVRDGASQRQNDAIEGA